MSVDPGPHVASASRPDGGQLVEVVGSADEHPFMMRLVESVQQELSEAQGLLDVAEHRLDSDLAQPLAAEASALFEAPPPRWLRPWVPTGPGCYRWGSAPRRPLLDGRRLLRPERCSPG